jgi:hypothetical protein
MSFSLGWSHVLLAAVGWWAAGRRLSGAEPNEKRRLLGFLGGWCAVLCVLMLAGSEWFWATLPLMKYIEFPWRMLAPASFCLALLAGAAAQAVLRIQARRRSALAAALGLLILPNLHHLAPPGYQPLDLRQWTPEQIARRGISVTSRNEYEPLGAELPAYPPNTGRVVAGWAQGELLRLSPEHWSGRVKAAAESTIEISCFFFPGWQAGVDGRGVPIEKAQASGLIRIAVPPGERQVELVFRRTPVRAAADALSALTALVLVVLWVWLGRIPATRKAELEPQPAAPNPKVEAGFRN